MATRSDPRRVLITGLHSFTGRYLAEALRQQGHEVHGTVMPGHNAPLGPHEHVVDLLDAQGVRAVVSRVRPHRVVHLAAISFVAAGDADLMYRTNIVGTRHVLQAITDTMADAPPAVLLPSSANVYGNTAVDQIDEDLPPCPANDYGISKLAMEHLARVWSDSVPIILVRPFNYTGRGQSLQFLLPKIVDAFRRRVPRLELGNLDVARDFTDVRDVAQAYVALMERTPQGVYNVCSGVAVALEEVLAMTRDITGHAPEIAVNPAFVRANELKRLRGSPERLRAAIGEWHPRPLRDTLEWMLSA